MFSFVANHLWQSTLFAGATYLLCLSLRNEGAHVRYWLWWAASAKFLIPFAWLVEIGSSLAPASAPIITSQSWASTAGLFATPIEQSRLPFWLGAALLTLWAAGFSAYIVRWTNYAARIKLAVRRAKRDRTVGTGRHLVTVYRSDDLPEPGVVGLLKPVLLVPNRMEEFLNDHQMAAVLAHELCHVNRRDNLTAVTQMIVEALFWFYPPVWVLGSRLVAERERACDEAVVAQGYCPETYAEGILNVCENFVKSPLASSAGVSGGDLTKRVAYIMRSTTMPKFGAIKKVLLTAIAACMVCIPVLAGYAGQPAEQEYEGLLPVHREPPQYPQEALQQGLNGHVDLQFTITPQGTTEDIAVVSSTSPLFEESAIRALEKFEYEPVSSAILNARIRIAFQLTN